MTNGCYALFAEILARQIMPDTNFSFHETNLEGKRVVVMVVPAASKIPTGFDF